MRERATPLVGIGVSPHAPYTVSDDLFAASARLAEELDLPLTVHAAEGEAEDLLVRSGTGEFADAWRARGIPVTVRSRSPLQLLHDTGVLGPRTLVVHAVHADAEDRALLRTSGSQVAHCPASNAKLGHGIAPLAELLNEGIGVGLGSDSVASGNRMDLLDDARLAVFQQRARLRQPTVLSAVELLHCATVGGARSLGLERTTGALVPGLQADLAAFHLDDPADVPCYAPEDALVFARGGRRSCLTVVAGREMVRDGRLIADLRADLGVVRDAAAAFSEGATGQG
jgi:5-methylthioadenosine/S-adenosylhomocysteine deaminase